MNEQFTNTANLRLLLPETLWLEPEHYQQARAISQAQGREDQQWQTYLNGLGQLAFADWLRERLPDCPIHREAIDVREVIALWIGDFKLCLMAVEHVLDEVVQIPRSAIEQPDWAAHFYVVLEVLEDQEQVVIRGFLRHDELVAYDQARPTSPGDDWCPVPLEVFDAEINHLVVYVQRVEPSAIPLPVATDRPVETSLLRDLSEAKTRLSQWLQEGLNEGWQVIDALVNPEANLAWGIRQASPSTKGGKLINLGVQLGNQPVVLLIAVTPESEEKIGVGAQVLPAGGAQILPPLLKLTLLSNADDKVLQAVESREQDNYIQLKPFRGKPGTSFSIEVSLNDIRVREGFEL